MYIYIYIHIYDTKKTSSTIDSKKEVAQNMAIYLNYYNNENTSIRNKRQSRMTTWIGTVGRRCPHTFGQCPKIRFQFWTFPFQERVQDDGKNVEEQEDGHNRKRWRVRAHFNCILAGWVGEGATTNITSIVYILYIIFYCII